MICIIYRFHGWRQHTICGNKTRRLPSFSDRRNARRWRQLFFALLCCLPAALASARTPEQTAAPFDYYVLALSWSPAYCAWNPADHSQCGQRRFAFVLHGLWPQYQAGGYPRQCANTRPSRPVIERALAFMPSATLIGHEWRKHGTCSGLAPGAYFIAAERAFSAVSIPPLFQADPIPQHLTAQDITRAFTDANPGLNSRRIALKCRGPELEEVRLCLDRALKPTDCGRGIKSHCRRGPIQIRPLR